MRRRDGSTATDSGNICATGRSWNRRKGDHDRGAVVQCYRCSAIMGCERCCESPTELICLACNNWARRAGVVKHGNVEPNGKVQHVRTDTGWKHWDLGQAERRPYNVRL